MDRKGCRKTYWEKAGGFLVAEIYISHEMNAYSDVDYRGQYFFSV
jgi:hypothetical protein